MKIEIENIGIIENALLQLDGLTVITGYNNSGKTTVGKVVYSLFTSLENVEMNILEDQKKYAISGLQRLWHNIIIRSGEKVNTKGFSNFFRDEIMKNIELIGRVKDIQTLNKVLVDLLNDLRGIFSNGYFKQLPNQFVEQKYKQCVDSVEEIQQIINTKFLKESYVNEKLELTLKKEFVDQILPLNKAGVIGRILLEDDLKRSLVFSIQNNKIIGSDSTLGDEIIDKNVVFLDNVFLLDEVSESNREAKWFVVEDEDETNISIKRHKDKLIDEIKQRNASTPTIIESILNKEKLDKIIATISKTFDEDIVIANDEIYSSNSKVCIENLAMGSKVFAILKLLLVKGIINEKTILVLDEPEVHLHPEWQSILAEILAVMIKELGIIVVLTTHSPQFMLALEYYTKKYEQEKSFHVYMTEERNIKAITYQEVTEHIQKAYYRLSKPMFEIKMDMEKLKE